MMTIFAISILAAASVAGHAGQRPNEENRTPQLFSSSPPILAIGVLVARMEQDRWRILTLGAPHAGLFGEKTLIRRFLDKIDEVKPVIVAYDSQREFAHLQKRAIHHAVAATKAAHARYFVADADGCVSLRRVLRVATPHPSSPQWSTPAWPGEGTPEEAAVEARANVVALWATFLGLEHFAGRLQDCGRDESLDELKNAIGPI